MEDNRISEIMDVTMSKIRQLVDTNTMVGEPIVTPDGITAIPISRVSFGFGTGGSSDLGKNKSYVGANGAGVKVEPVGFLIIKDGVCRMMNIAPSPTNTAERVVEMLPELIDKVEAFVNKQTNKGNTL